MNILIVDSDPEMVGFLQKSAQDQGHRVSICRSGTEALTSTLRQDYDLFICSVDLPDLSGADLVGAIKAQHPHLPIIAIGWGEEESWTAECEAAGATKCFRHPVPLKELMQEVKLVEMTRTGLRIVIVDPDAIHRARLRNTLSAQRCDVHAVGGMTEALRHMTQGQDPHILLMDAALPSILEHLRMIQTRGMMAIVFADQLPEATEDPLMRAGAALILRKPIDCDALITQARFFASF